MAARSSLEQMLDSIRERDNRPRDAPPALPNRPVKRGRLPTARRFISAVDPSERVAPPRRRRLSAPEEPEESPYDPESRNYEGRKFGDFIVSPVPTSPFLLEARVSVWCRLPNGNWGRGTVRSLSGEDAHISLPDGIVLKLPKENILPANPDTLDGVDDLLELNYINEPSVLHNLHCRYSSDKVFTKAGPVLIAVNPLKEVPLQGNDEFHVYAVVDDAYKEMMKDGSCQSIIMSGESGSGKTETAKIALKHLAKLGGKSDIERRILPANLILESFGNAKTRQSKNSSRFGKLVEMWFTVTGKLCGAKIQTLLLEKSRVVRRAMDERSYHIFYQLCAGAPQFLKERLDLREASEYEYLKFNRCLAADDVADAKGFHLLMKAFDAAQISKENQDKVLEVISAVLWLGNVSFLVINDENHVDVVPNEGLSNAARLLGCSVEDLILAVTTDRIQMGEDTVIHKLTLKQAVDARDALAMFVYVSLFDWLVDQVNKSLEAGESHVGRTISILDIYGFEIRNKNEFEHFCINYANERLQQHFNRYLFKLEKEEYVEDGVEWTRADFMDNTECLNLFEKKPLGLLSLLDQESTLPKSTGLTFANKLREHLKGNSCFKSERDVEFKVAHYAREVSYDTSEFLEKNRDLLYPGAVELLLSNSFFLPELLVSNLLACSQKPLTYFRESSGTAMQKQGVCMKLKTQLFALMQHLDNTTPHFICCLKPNENKIPGVFEKGIVLQQLMCCGLLEAMRISRMGYPTRITHQKFVARYGLLLPKEVSSQDPLSVSVIILQKFNVLPEMYQVGHSKLFFHAGQISSLEDIRTRTLRGIVCVQKYFRGLQARHSFIELINATTVLQSFVRGENARKELKSNLRRWKAATTLQSVLRGKMTKKHLCDLRNRKSSVTKNVSCKASVKIEDTTPGLEELQRRIFMVEKALQEKEEENLSLHRQLKQCEVRWSQYEEKMRCMEVTWQKQLISLQTSLAEARSRLTADDVVSLQGKVDALSPSPHLYDSEDTVSIETRTPEVTPPRISRPSTTSRLLARNSNGAVPHLLREFEQKKKGFEDDALSLVEVKINTSSAAEELRKLKLQFGAWKKEYRVKLHETRLALEKAENHESERSRRRRWWEKLTGK